MLPEDSLWAAAAAETAQNLWVEAVGMMQIQSAGRSCRYPSDHIQSAELASSEYTAVAFEDVASARSYFALQVQADLGSRSSEVQAVQRTRFVGNFVAQTGFVLAEEEEMMLDLVGMVQKVFVLPEPPQIAGIFDQIMNDQHP